MRAVPSGLPSIPWFPHSCTLFQLPQRQPRHSTITDNPYSSPRTAPTTDMESAAARGNRPLSTIAREVFLSWEKLRIAYVAVLALITVLAVGPYGFGHRRLLRLIVEGAVAANVAYFAGPALETYIRWLGYDRTWPRWVMFVGGTLFSIVLTVAVLATELLPDQD